MIAELSGLAFPEDSSYRRDPAVKPAYRGDDYLDKYDFSTLFYDAVWIAEKTAIVLVCPKLINFRKLLQRGHFDSELGNHKILRIVSGRRYSEVWLNAGSIPQQMTFNIDGDQFHFNVSQQETAYFSKKRCLITISRNNRLEWITDWLIWHQKVHGLKAAVIFDNASDAYTIEVLDSHLEKHCPELDIVVVSANLTYGPRGIKRKRSSSKYLQSGLFNLARLRFFPDSASVLGLDIDELVQPVENSSIFEKAEMSILGLVTFRGKWLYPVPGSTTGQLHRDHIYSIINDRKVCPYKWCVVPSRFAGKTSWDVHTIGNKFLNRIARLPSAAYWHLLSVNTSWKRDRGVHGSIDLVKNRRAITAFNSVFAKPDNPSSL